MVCLAELDTPYASSMRVLIAHVWLVKKSNAAAPAP
jgi:hypothetical protein